MKTIYQYYPRNVRMPNNGDVVELTSRKSNGIEALGKVVERSKKRRFAFINIIVSDEKEN